MKKLIAVVLVVLVAFVTYNVLNAKGIVTVPGYEHGVAFCQEEYSHVIHTNEGHFWADGTAMYVVNNGHLNDPEVEELKAAAASECAQYMNK